MAKPVTNDIDPDDAPELDEAWFATARPAAEVHPEAVLRQFGKPGRPKSAAPKVAVKLRLDPDVVAAFRNSGAGWQTRMNDVLRVSISGGQFIVERGAKAEPAANVAKKRA